MGVIFQGPVLCFYCVGPRVRTQAGKVGGKRLYPGEPWRQRIFLYLFYARSSLKLQGTGDPRASIALHWVLLACVPECDKLPLGLLVRLMMTTAFNACLSIHTPKDKETNEDSK